MPAYVIFEIDVIDPVGYEEYKKLAPGAVAEYGGRYLVRGGPVEILEGDWEPKRLVVVEFENAEKAKAWWSSPEYSRAKTLRQKTAATNLIVVEGT